MIDICMWECGELHSFEALCCRMRFWGLGLFGVAWMCVWWKLRFVRLWSLGVFDENFDFVRLGSLAVECVFDESFVRLGVKHLRKDNWWELHSVDLIRKFKFVERYVWYPLLVNTALFGTISLRGPSLGACRELRSLSVLWTLFKMRVYWVSLSFGPNTVKYVVLMTTLVCGSTRSLDAMCVC